MKVQSMKELLEQLAKWLNADPREHPRTISVTAPTGSGKTVGTIEAMIELAEADENMLCFALMPFRASVKTMHHYIQERCPNRGIGICMGGHRQVSPGEDHIMLFTCGAWLNYGLTEYVLSQPEGTPMTFFVDEIHDLSWHTDLALRILFDLQKTRPIRIVTASATQPHNSRIEGIKYLELQESVSKNIITYGELSPMDIQRYLLNPQNLIRSLHDRLIEIVDTTGGAGDILVILPGLDEILGLVSRLESHEKATCSIRFSGFDIFLVHSKLSKEEIHAAVNKPRGHLKRRIILSTNILESAITIPDLLFVLDGCVRKIVKIGDDGIKSITPVLASRNNLIQSAGRVGRMGTPGHVHYLLDEYTFNSLLPSHTPEAFLGPKYSQILHLVAAKLPLNILINTHISPFDRNLSSWGYVIDKNFDELLDKGMILRTSDSSSSEDSSNSSDSDSSDDYVSTYDQFANAAILELSEMGEMMRRVELSLNAMMFLSQALEPSHSTSKTPFIGVAVACWLDLSSSLFYSPIKKPGTSASDFKDIKKESVDRQSKFYKTDCLESALAILLTFIAEGNPKIYKWCKQNGLYDKALIEWTRNIDSTLNALYKMGTIIPYPTPEEADQLMEDVLNHEDKYRFTVGDLYLHPKVEMSLILLSIFKSGQSLATGRDKQGRPSCYTCPYYSFVDRSVPEPIAKGLISFVACSVHKVAQKLSLSKTVLLY